MCLCVRIWLLVAAQGPQSSQTSCRLDFLISRDNSTLSRGQHISVQARTILCYAPQTCEPGAPDIPRARAAPDSWCVCECSPAVACVRCALDTQSSQRWTPFLLLDTNKPVAFRKPLTLSTKNACYYCCARPLGFDLSEREVKRAGLDHWNHVDLTVHDSW